MRKLARAGIAGAAVLAIGAGSAFAMNSSESAGAQGDGTAVTPAGWRVTPAGTQTTLGKLPTATALSPDGKLLLVLNTGDTDAQQLQAVDPGSHRVVQTLGYKAPDGLYAGVAFSPDGKHAYASAGGGNTIHTYAVNGQHLTEQAPIALPTKNPAGQAVNTYPAGLAVTPDGKRLVVADQQTDSASVVDLTTRQINTVPVGHNPYAVALSPDGRTAYVSNQGANTLSALDVSGPTPKVTRTITVGTHPNRLAVDKRTGTVFAANSESDSVSVIPVGAPQSTIDLAPYRGAPIGSNPDDLALSGDGSTLYVANSGNNDVDVVDARTGKVRGMIPTAWYPTSVTPSPDGRTLYVTNAKGLGAGPNDGPGYPNPNSPVGDGYGAPDQYSGSMISGSLSTIAVPDDAQLARYSQQVVADDGFDERDKVRNAVPNNPVPARAGDPSPIKHVIYVVKENRTYDQVFGSLGKGNGDPKLNLFGDDSAPNSRALQRRFVTLDNTYANAEISAQGWSWSVGANSNPYVEQTWAANYSNRNHPYDYEGGNLATAPNRDPADAYIWDKLADKKIPFRNYGFYESDNKFNSGPQAPDPRLVANSDPNFYGWDLKCPDSAGTFTPETRCNTRIDEWKREFAGYEAHNNLPTMQFLRLPNDHTQTTKPGEPTPSAYVADNDYALGQLVDTVSHSKDWASTAIFVVEDDAQDGPDHVDAHRMPAQVISPYTQTGKVDSTHYSTVSVLRTIEQLVGLGPLTQFDAQATPMFNSFTNKPDFTPYTAVKPPQQVLSARNGQNAPMAAQAARQDFTKEDKVDQQTANQAIWQSVKGAGSPMPAPVHPAGFAAPPPAAERDGDGDGD